MRRLAWRYASRLTNARECWAVFGDIELATSETRSIELNTEGVQELASFLRAHHSPDARPMLLSTSSPLRGGPHLVTPFANSIDGRSRRGAVQGWPGAGSASAVSSPWQSTTRSTAEGHQITHRRKPGSNQENAANA